MACYAELYCQTNYSFLQAASKPEELVQQAKKLGYQALAITDECSLSGVVRAHQIAKSCQLPLIIGSVFHLKNNDDDLSLILLAQNMSGYGKLCRIISKARRNANKGLYVINRKDFENNLSGCTLLLVYQHENAVEQIAWLTSLKHAASYLAISLQRDGHDLSHLQDAQKLANKADIKCIAVGAVLMHQRKRRVVLDLLQAIHHNTTVAKLGKHAAKNSERHLRTIEDLSKLYPTSLLQQTCLVAKQCLFSLDEVRYLYPDDVTPKGQNAHSFLRQLTEVGIKKRWPNGCSDKVRAQIEHELILIEELNYEPYFLTIWDIVRFARSQKILCQGRGSAANSAVCYCLEITEVDPSRMNLLFERFISRERNEPPDIDVDFEHERREEVIQYIYQKYGRERAALAATIITYRSKSALRDTTKALGFSLEHSESLVSAVSGWRRGGEVKADYLIEAGFDPNNPLIKQALYLSNTIIGFPRHLSQHVGGFIIAQGRLDELVPIENASMPKRTVIQWEKDDLEALGLLKVDILSLGMLSAIRRSLDLINAYQCSSLQLHQIPSEDPSVYAMLQKADTIGVFQIESRAQMSMLPRLRPENFYDLVIEIAIVRPGPIQGDMVHPYLRRKQGLEAISYPSKAVKSVLERTLGVPIFQEQVIKLAMVAAGFSPGEADKLRRDMAAWKKRGGMEVHRDNLMSGMLQRGYTQGFAERIYQQILGFGDYGFPESHSASFALLAYASAWLKCHHPAAFCAALINSQPMGFYQPAQLIIDAKNHGVDVLPIDVAKSDWDCTLETVKSEVKLRLGLCLVSGLSKQGAYRLVNKRNCKPYQNINELTQRAQLIKSDLKALAAADAFISLSGDRHRAAWDVAGIEAANPLLGQAHFNEHQPDLFPPNQTQAVLADYAHTGLSLRSHPLALIRQQLRQRNFLSAKDIAAIPNGRGVRTAGLILIRQRPGNGKAVFVTLEDETGNLNLLIWADLAEKQRKTLLGAKLLGVNATIQRAEGVQHLKVNRLEDHSDLLGVLEIKSRNFH